MNSPTRNRRVVADKQTAKTLFNEQRLTESGELYRRICKADPRDAEAWFMLGVINGQLGRLEEAVLCGRKVIALQPNSPEAHFNLAKALSDQGRMADAEAGYKQALALRPNWPQALNNLGNCLQTQGKVEEALACFRRAVELKPDYSRVYINMGNVMRSMGGSQEAEASYRHALSINAAEPGAYEGLATIYMLRGDYEEALRCYELLAQLTPGKVNLPVIKASIFEKQGRMEEAYEIIQPLIDQGDESAAVALLFGSLCRHVDRRDDAVAVLKRAVEKTDQQDGDTRALHFKLGSLFDTQGDYEQAFHHFQSGNALKKCEFDSDTFAAFIDQLIETFSSEFVAAMPRAVHGSERPLFIVGMPRSGTTLVEQILASHPQVFGAGEEESLRYIVTGLPEVSGTAIEFPACTKGLTVQTCDQLAQRYLGKLDQLADAERFVSNKVPNNFLYLGLIAMLFPKARIIHCMRDPLDTCLSCYVNDFSGTHSYAYDLENLGVYYRNYRRLMQHWHEVLDMPILDIHNEELVADQEGVTRRLLEFCDLEWDERCLRFYENERGVTTLSYDQVRRPLSSHSIGRWRNYDAYLEPLKQALKEN